MGPDMVYPLPSQSLSSVWLSRIGSSGEMFRVLFTALPKSLEISHAWEFQFFGRGNPIRLKS